MNDPLPDGVIEIKVDFEKLKQEMKNEIAPKAKTAEDHRRRHELLHRMLDELVADWHIETGKLYSNATILDLMNWSYQQTVEPSDRHGLFQNEP